MACSKRTFWGHHFAINLKHFFESSVSFLCYVNISVALDFLDSVKLLRFQIQLSRLFQCHALGRATSAPLRLLTLRDSRPLTLVALGHV